MIFECLFLDYHDGYHHECPIRYWVETNPKTFGLYQDDYHNQQDGLRDIQQNSQQNPLSRDA